MRHQVGVAKLGKTPAHRRAMLRNMVTSLFKHERIVTTAPKAKEAKRWAERMITFGKAGDLHARRQAARFVNDETVLKKLFDEIAPAFKERQGGYTRVLRMGPRKGDVAERAVLELVTKNAARAKPKNRKTREHLAEFKPKDKTARAKKKAPKAAKPEA
jgi:large subunit ribosomal protein L17